MTNQTEAAKPEAAQECGGPVDPLVMFRDLDAWLKSGEYLPEFLREFHDQKDLFKTMHLLYRDSEAAPEMPNWVQGHQYVIDWFLWYMASRGYTLQKSRKNIQFREFQTWRDW